MDSGALDSLVTCLEEFDPGVKEAAGWCLGYIAGHNAELAQQVVDAGEGRPAAHWCGAVVAAQTLAAGRGRSPNVVRCGRKTQRRVCCCRCRAAAGAVSPGA